MTFESFIIDDTNKGAYSVCREIAEGLNICPKWIILCGPTGCGKTHLLHAIETYVNKMYDKNKAVLYVNAKTFTEDMVSYLKKEDTQFFYSKYRRPQILLMDHIEFFSGKPQTQEFVFQFLQDMIKIGKQIVLATSQKPDGLKLNDKVTKIQTIANPGENLIRRFVDIKCKNMGINLSEDAVTYFLDKPLCEVEGYLKRIRLLFGDTTAPKVSAKWVKDHIISV